MALKRALKREWKQALGVLVVLALILVGVCAYFDLDTPNEELCPQAEVLLEARLLDEAKDMAGEAEGAGEECPQREDAELKLAEAERHFELAEVYATASPAPERAADGKLKPEQPDRAIIGPNSAKAIDELAEGLAINPFDGDAAEELTAELKKGLVDSAKQCETGSNLVAAGLLEAGGAALAKGLEGGNPACAEGVRTLRDALTLAASELRAAGGVSNPTAKRKAYAAALQVNADLAGARSGLEDSLDQDSCLDEFGDWLDGIPDTLKSWLPWAIPLAVGLLLLALGFWILVREASARFRWARGAFEWLGQLPGLTFLYKAAVPDIEVKPFDGKGEDDLEGASFARLLAADLARPAGREPTFPFDRIARGQAPGGGVGDSVTELLNEIPATKPLGSAFKLVSKLFRRRTITLTGHLTPLSDEGAGVQLAIEGSRGELNKTITLRERSYDPKPGGKGASRWLRLIPAAGVWARWHLQAAQDPTRDVDVRNWKADALAQSAQAWQLKDDLKRAEALYVEALERDPVLAPATHNLAMLEIRNRRYRQAEEREQRLRTVLESQEDEGENAARLKRQWPTLNTASLYILMLALAYPTIDKESEAGGSLEQAVARGRQLVLALAAELDSIDEKAEEKEEDEGRDPTTAEQLRLAELPSVVVLASLAVREAQSAQKQKAVEHAVDKGKDVGEIAREDITKDETVQRPWRMIHGYVLMREELTRRTHYNLACYYTTLSELIEPKWPKADEWREKCLDLALESLRAGLAGGNLVAWAPKDPSLAPLRSTRKKDFDELLAERTVAAHGDEVKAPGKPEEEVDPELAKRFSARMARLEARWMKRFGQ